ARHHLAQGADGVELRHDGRSGEDGQLPDDPGAHALDGRAEHELLIRATCPGRLERSRRPRATPLTHHLQTKHEATKMLGFSGSKGVKVAGAMVALGLALTVSACTDSLNVDLPADLTSDALNDPVGAASQINSVIVLFENSMAEFKWIISGHEDTGEIVFM